jgi:hypothetical protein
VGPATGGTGNSYGGCHEVWTVDVGYGTAKRWPGNGRRASFFWATEESTSRSRGHEQELPPVEELVFVRLVRMLLLVLSR